MTEYLLTEKYKKCMLFGRLLSALSTFKYTQGLQDVLKRDDF